MTLVKWNPTRSLLDLSNDFDRLVDSFFNRDLMVPEVLGMSYPVMDVEETDDEFRITAELPGMKKDDVKITFQDNILTISGEKKSEKKREDKNLYYAERRFGKFSRSVSINSPVKLDKVSAEFKDGILHITVPKAEEAKPKQIEVKVK
ncbi:MAG TPA: Hsp20/alpha crystallin family protein [Caldithrix abyssi]|uniref:Hsp20/alpha crystallin family protein n=1 Tax=Caldithrix abyssi TaxID=187145 RepID=A0A7V4U2V8_CALAY|nr:Hsp20/alpha crystallin family protein [Caldithrix abyssi]